MYLTNFIKFIFLFQDNLILEREKSIQRKSAKIGLKLFSLMWKVGANNFVDEYMIKYSYVS